LTPLPFRSPAGGLPRGSSRSMPAYHVVAVVRRPMRCAPPRVCPPTATVPSAAGVTGASATRPSPEKSRSSTILGAPVLVVMRPSTPGSTPVSRIAIRTPRPSYVGCWARNWSTPVSFNGMSPVMNAMAGGSAGSRADTAVASAGAGGAAPAGVGAHRIRSRRVLRVGHPVSENGLDRGLTLHHAHPAGRPRDDEIGVEALSRHGVVARSRGVVHRQNEFGHRGGGHCFHEARPGADDARVFGVSPDHEARHVLDEEQGHPLAIRV